MHRDIKPENIMLHSKKRGEPKKIYLIDFGTGLKYSPGQNQRDFAGTAYYVAPEVLKRKYTKSCDIWSIGVITYILLVSSHVIE